MSAILAKHTVGVLGSGSDEHAELAGAVGELLARLGVNLLTGGGGGVMAAVSRAYTRAPRARGICIGVLPCAGERERGRPRPGYPNEYVELAIQTHLPFSGERGTGDLSRNHINVLSCAAVIALPGGAGTASELTLALRYGRPALVFAPDPAGVGAFPGEVSRATTIAAVEEFLRDRLGLSRP